jgi:hypothetical protein
MVRPHLNSLGLCLVALLVVPLVWAQPPSEGQPPAPPAATTDLDATTVAARLDGYIAARWQATGTPPAAAAADAAFLRRVYLDVVGRIPAVSDVRRFLRDTAPDKRRQVVERLLDSPGYVSNFTNVWRVLMIPEIENDPNLRYLGVSFEPWLRKQFAANVPYDKMIRDLITAPVQQGRNQYFNPYDGNNQASPLAYYFAKQAKPENIAAGTARLFLGVRIECAQCHDHPFARWKREQFWGYASFFAGIKGQGQDGFIGMIRELPDRREMVIPRTDQVAQAAFLDGTQPRWKFKVGARTTLADWMTSGENPFFARALVNRMWAHFFGTGLVEPVDDFSDEHQPSHPQVLDDLTREFVSHNFDLKFLIRAITRTRAYNLSSAAGDERQNDPALFARMMVRGLTPEQLFDSFAQATGYKDPTPANQRFFIINSMRTDFLGKFSHPDKRTEVQTSIPQALAVMNNRLIADATSLERSEMLAAVSDAPFMDTVGKLETLFLSTLSRKPTPEELAKFGSYVEGGGPKKDSKRALADVLWALLNSGEFIFNH